MQWTGTLQPWSRRSFTTLIATNVWCIGVNPVLALQLWKNFLIRNSTSMKMIRNLITVSETLQLINIDKLYSHLRIILRNFDWCYWQFDKTFLYRKAKNYQCLIQGEIQSYPSSKVYCKLHCLIKYYLGPNGSLQHDSLCFSSDYNNHYTSFLYQVQAMLIYYLKANHSHIINS